MLIHHRRARNCVFVSLRLASDTFFSFSESGYLRTTYFPVFIYRSLCFDPFILVLNLLAVSALALVLQHLTRKQLLANLKADES